MNIDGRTIARELQRELKGRVTSLGKVPVLRVLVLQSDPTTKQFIAIKSRVGKRIGVDVIVEDCSGIKTTDDLKEKINEVVGNSDGIIVQLPLPDSINRHEIFTHIPTTHDVDSISDDAMKEFEKGKSVVLPPVIGAMKHILKRSNITVTDKRVVIIGEGRLVGRPAALWFDQEGADVTTLNRATEDISVETQKADIIVLGAGVPGILRPDMIHDKVVVLDAGTSESGGKVVGDADPAIGEKALLFTPTPGGIGPIAVTMIFANFLTLIESNK